MEVPEQGTVHLSWRALDSRGESSDGGERSEQPRAGGQDFEVSAGRETTLSICAQG